jgi:hypothetical protein
MKKSASYVVLAKHPDDLSARPTQVSEPIKKEKSIFCGGRSILKAKSQITYILRDAMRGIE